MLPVIEQETIKRATKQTYGMEIVITQRVELREEPPHRVLNPIIHISDMRSDNRNILSGTPNDLKRLRNVMDDVEKLLMDEFEPPHS